MWPLSQAVERFLNKNMADVGRHNQGPEEFLEYCVPVQDGHVR